MAIMNELPTRTGDVIVDGSTAYTAQQSWIFSGTLRENILLGSTFEETKYTNSIRLCALKTVSLLKVAISYQITNMHKLYITVVLKTWKRQYAVKVQRSLAPLSWFRGSHILTAHEQECCRFQSYANSVHCL